MSRIRPKSLPGIMTDTSTSRKPTKARMQWRPRGERTQPNIDDMCENPPGGWATRVELRDGDRQSENFAEEAAVFGRSPTIL
eukprot:m.111147 g.111147  ORF g.111147 m.111147 type:complete len:82 (-) comp16994_c0_seq1:668-913(-)